MDAVMTARTGTGLQAAARILEALSVGAGELLNSPDMEQATPLLLRRLGEAVDVSRVYVFETRDEGDADARLWQRHEWCAPGISPEIDNPATQGVLFSELGCSRWYELMSRGEAVFGNVGDFPSSEREILNEQGIHSLACFPIRLDRKLVGFIGFDDCIRRRDWIQAERDALHTAAELIAATWRHSREQKTEQEREQLFRMLAEQTSDVISMGDASGKLLYASPAVRKSLGYSPDEVVGRSFYEFLHPDDELGFEKGVSGLLSDHLFVSALNYRVRHRDGHWVWMETRLNPLPGEDEQARWVAASRDISERKQFEQELADEKERALATLRSIADGVVVVDSQGLVEYINPAAEKITGVPSSRAKTMRALELLRPESGQLPSTGGLAELSDWYRRLGGGAFDIRDAESNTRSIQLSVSPIHGSGSEPVGLVLSFRDVSRTNELLRELAFRASHDSLTGLYNREEFERQLRQFVQQAVSNDSHHALCYIDLDQFKLVNDTSGHPAGDALLKEVGEVLQAQLDDEDVLARLGGDEFGVLMPQHGVWQAARRAQDLVDHLARLRFEWGGRQFTIGGSIGVAPIDRDAGTSESVMMAADAACYVAKERGRNRVHVFEPSDVAVARRQGEMRWIPRLQTALEVDDFILFAHDIVPTSVDRPTGRHLEVLIALPGANGRLIPPGEFLPAAQRYGLIGRIDRWVVGQVVRWMLERQRRAAPEMRLVAVNLSGSSLSDPEFRDFVEEQISLLRQPDWLCFEITESEAVASLNEAREFIQRMRGYGCRFALDDFGAGLSSFAYLKRLPVDILKIDGQFVREIHRDPVNWAMVEAISHVARVMGLQTVAEFVEDERIFEGCRQIGVDYCQGFYFGRPVPLTSMA